MKCKSTQSHAPKKAGSIIYSTARDSLNRGSTQIRLQRKLLTKNPFKAPFIAVEVYLHNIYSFLSLPLCKFSLSATFTVVFVICHQWTYKAQCVYCAFCFKPHFLLESKRSENKLRYFRMAFDLLCRRKRQTFSFSLWDMWNPDSNTQNATSATPVRAQRLWLTWEDVLCIVLRLIWIVWVLLKRNHSLYVNHIKPIAFINFFFLFFFSLNIRKLQPNHVQHV